MSWDIFVQDLPVDAASADDISDDFEPGPLMARAALIENILQVVPTADFSDPTWGRIEGPDYDIEVSIDDEDPVESFTFHVRGGDMSAGIVADVLDHLDVRAIDPSSDSGLFDPTAAGDSLRRWRAYRDQVV